MKKLLLLLIIPFLSFGQIVTEDCSSIPDPGMCFAAIEIYYFDQNTGQCEESIFYLSTFYIYSVSYKYFLAK